MLERSHIALPPISLCQLHEVSAEFDVVFQRACPHANILMAIGVAH